MLILRYKALFGLLVAVILNCETASEFGGIRGLEVGRWCERGQMWGWARRVYDGLASPIDVFPMCFACPCADDGDGLDGASTFMKWLS
jgi:hypothetical protein